MTEPYYDHDGITIYNGDNVAVMSELKAGSIDLVVTSPPYGDLRTYGGHSWDFEGVAQQLWRVVKPGGVVVWVVADQTIDGSESGESFRQALRFKEIGFRLHDTMIYKKAAVGACGSNRAYWQEFEFMFVLSNGSPNSVHRIVDKKNSTAGTKRTPTRKQNAIGSRSHGTITIAQSGVRGNVWEYMTGPIFGTSDATAHTAPFPEALARDHILSWSNEGDTVLDCFNGSGTTTKMAKHNGRKAIGIEIEEKYCEIAAERLRQKVLF